MVKNRNISRFILSIVNISKGLWLGLIWRSCSESCYMALSEMWSEAIKILKGEYAIRAIKEHKMDQAIIFCRTKIDCDNMEQHLIKQGGGEAGTQLGLLASLSNSHYMPSSLDANICLFLQVQTRKDTSFLASVFMATGNRMSASITWSNSR